MIALHPAAAPLIPAWLIEARTAEGRMRLSAEGLEKRCSRCQEFWPADTEFFSPNKRSPEGLKAWCRCCCQEHQRIVRARN